VDVALRPSQRMDVVQLLGANVRRYRKLAGMSQEALALEAGMKRSYVSDVERGTRNPSVRALGRLAEALKVEPNILLEPGGKPLARDRRVHDH
jgi:transcriptional regulator with XRE-family HTH domain